jgi:hypothetical protein
MIDFINFNPHSAVSKTQRKRQGKSEYDQVPKSGLSVNWKIYLGVLGCPNTPRKDFREN